jgi:hypothetical protein
MVLVRPKVSSTRLGSLRDRCRLLDQYSMPIIGAKAQSSKKGFPECEATMREALKMGLKA